MTRRQLRVIAVLSLVCTGVILAEGAPRDAAGRLPAAKPVIVHAPLPASAREEAAAPVASPAESAAVEDTLPADTSTSASPSRTRASSRGQGTATSTKPRPSKVKHVFVIALTGTTSDEAFGPQSPAPYLRGDLLERGTVLPDFRPVDQADLPNYLAATSGQPPNAATRAECTTFSDFSPSARTAHDGTMSGDGCVYPNTVLSIGDQLSSSARTWRAYAGGMAADQTCRHPVPGSPDDTLHARAGDAYATRHNPFVYFHSLLDLSDCQANDVPLAQLRKDLKSVAKTPAYSFIAPDLCDSGTETPCVDGRPGGLASADAFLKAWVPRILRSPAYRRDGALVIAFLSTATPTPGAAAPPRTGALVLSRFAKAGATLSKPYDAYSLLRSVEDLLALKPLGRAGKATSFAKTVLAKAFAS